MTSSDGPVTNRQQQYFCSGQCLAGAVVQSGFNSVFMMLPLWVECLCLDNSRAQRLERDRKVNQSIARGLESGFVDWSVLMVCVIWTESLKAHEMQPGPLGD